VTLAVIDTGCITQHTWWGKNMVTAAHEEPPVPGQPLSMLRGHGTFIVGIVRRLAPTVKVVARQVPVETNFTEFAVAEEMVKAAMTDGAAVINVSLGTCPIDGLPPVAMGGAVSALLVQYGDNLAIVASAGNDGTEHAVYPAAFPGVIGVGAIDAQRSRTTFSNFGSWVQACAPGRHVSTYFGEHNPITIDPFGTFEGYAAWEGSSFAAPVVAARIANTVAAGNLARPSIAAVLGASRIAVSGLGRLVE
jgi:subtilisin family serine protease